MEKTKMFFAIGIAVALVLVISAVVWSLPGALEFDGSQDDEDSLVIEDATGEEVSLEAPPERIVSFMPSNTELLFHLEVGERIVGVDDFSNHPEEALDLPKVGDSLEVDYEKIVDLEPDVVVITEAVTHLREQLKEYGIKTVATGGETLEDVYSDLELLGEMCGVEERAEEKSQDLREKMDEITDETRDLSDEKRIDVLYISGTYDGINTPGDGTFQDTLLTNAGGHNIASDKDGWSQIDESEIIDRDPEVIIAPYHLEQDLEEYTEKDSWQDITAVEDNEIHFVDSDVMSRPGPRIVEAQETLVEILQNGEDDDTSADQEVKMDWTELRINSSKKMVVEA